MFTIFQAFNKKLYQDLQYNRDLRVTFNNITEDNITRKSGTKTLNTIPGFRQYSPSPLNSRDRAKEKQTRVLQKVRRNDEERTIVPSHPLALHFSTCAQLSSTS